VVPGPEWRYEARQLLVIVQRIGGLPRYDRACTYRARCDRDSNGALVRAVLALWTIWAASRVARTTEGNAMRSRITRLLPVLLVAATLEGCRHEAVDDQRTGTITAEEIARARADWPPGVVAQVDSGNAAYSGQDYERAARYYRRAAEFGPEVSAAWFGIYISEHARGNVAAAESAMQRTRQLAPRASLLYASPRDTGPRRQ
jgi:hypothetical protein